MVAISKPVNAYTSNKTDCEKAAVVGAGPGAYACGLRKKSPAAMKMMIGTSLPTVNKLLTTAACRIPSKFTIASITTTSTMIVARHGGEVAGVQKKLR